MKQDDSKRGFRKEAAAAKSVGEAASEEEVPRAVRRGKAFAFHCPYSQGEPIQEIQGYIQTHLKRISTHVDVKCI